MNAFWVAGEYGQAGKSVAGEERQRDELLPHRRRAARGRSEQLPEKRT